MELPSYFHKFLKEIRPSENQRNDCKSGHKTLRDRLYNDVDLEPIIISTFLQGSYRRSTAVRPNKDKRLDVDVIIVTSLDRNDYPDPNKAMDLFVPFLEKHYNGKYKKQGRSFGIELSHIDIDMVITAAPSEADEKILKSSAVTTFETLEDATDWRLVESWVPTSERYSDYSVALMEKARKEAEWKTQPLLIPNRDILAWDLTHPLEQIKWTYGKNARCNGHYVNVVKAIKWWQLINYQNDSPKGYPLEHVVGICCPDSIQSIAEGVTLTFENLINNYKSYDKPILPDHGVPEHDVFARVTSEDFAKFYEHVSLAAKTAREALDITDSVRDSAIKWSELFGEKFPPPSEDRDNEDDDNGGQKGPFIPPSPKSYTGDLTPRRYGFDV